MLKGERFRRDSVLKGERFSVEGERFIVEGGEIQWKGRDSVLKGRDSVLKGERFRVESEIFPENDYLYDYSYKFFDKVLARKEHF